MDPLPIAFASPREYLQHLSVALASLFAHSPAGRLNVYIINTDFDRAAWGQLLKVNRKFRNNLVDVKTSDASLDLAASSGEYAKNTYRKILIPDLIPHDKVLYLDSDLVVTAPLDDLYAVNVDDAFLAAVANPGFSRHRELGMDSQSNYFNAGVMVLNLKKWRENSITEKVIQFAQTHPNSVLADQDGINAVINGRWIELPPQYNLQTYYFENPGNSHSLPVAVREAMAAPAIIHFTGQPKPWHFMSRDRYKSIYWKYLRKTPFRFYVPADFTLANLAKRLLPAAMKPHLAGCLKRMGRQTRQAH